jgi:dienelactone hydrolase
MVTATLGFAPAALRLTTGLVLALALGCLLVQPARGQFPVPGAGAEEKKGGSFTFNWAKINYWQFEPKNAKGPLPAIVVLHGIEGLDAFANGGNLPEDIAANYKLVCKMVAEKGYVVRLVHYMQCNPIKAKQVPELQQQIKANLLAPPGKVDPKIKKLFETWMSCVKGAVDDLRDAKNPANGNIDRDRVGVIGLSMGGFVAMSLAVTEPKFAPQAIVVVCGGLPEQLHKKVGKLPPILMICGTKDDVVPISHTCKVRNCLEDKDCSVTLVPFPCYHMFLDGKVDSKPKPKLQLNMVLQAQNWAEVFLSQHVKNAPRKENPKN